jgi:Tol biopolymer transport system component
VVVSREDDASVVAGFEHRLAAVEELIPRAAEWKAPNDPVRPRVIVLPGSAARSGQRSQHAAGRALTTAAVVVVGLVAVLAVAFVLRSRPSADPSVGGPVTSPSSRTPRPAGATPPAGLAGQTLLVAARVDGNLDLYLATIGGGPRTRVTSDAAPDREGSWAPDGDWIVVTRGTEGSSRLLFVPPDGSDERPLTGETFAASAPAVSPDGGMVVFIHSVASGGRELWSIGIDGSGPTRLVEAHPFIGTPAWSADGRSIYFLLDDSPGGAIEIRRITLDTGEVVRLDRCSGDDSGLAVSPDGSQLAYQTDCGGGIWLADADLANGRHLFGAEDRGYPLSWSPGGRWLAHATPDGVVLLDTQSMEPDPVPVGPGEFVAWRPGPP